MMQSTVLNAMFMPRHRRRNGEKSGRASDRGVIRANRMSGGPFAMI